MKAINNSTDIVITTFNNVKYYLILIQPFFKASEIFQRTIFQSFFLKSLSALVNSHDTHNLCCSFAQTVLIVLKAHLIHKKGPGLAANPKQSAYRKICDSELMNSLINIAQLEDRESKKSVCDILATICIYEPDIATEIINKVLDTLSYFIFSGKLDNQNLIFFQNIFTELMTIENNPAASKKNFEFIFCSAPLGSSQSFIEIMKSGSTRGIKQIELIFVVFLHHFQFANDTLLLNTVKDHLQTFKDVSELIETAIHNTITNMFDQSSKGL